MTADIRTVRARDGRIVGIHVPRDFEQFGSYEPYDGQRAYVSAADQPLQIAVLTGPPGYRGQPHVHDPLPASAWPSRHTVFVAVAGRARIDLYERDGTPAGGVDLDSGDCVLSTEGHRVALRSPAARVIEIKQGPWPGSTDADRRVLDGADRTTE